MKIVSIFVPCLYAFQFDDETENELQKALIQWRDTEYLFEFIQQHLADILRNENKQLLPQKLINDADQIDDIIWKYAEEQIPLEQFFKPLHNQEYQAVVLSKQKGRYQRSYLRLYALKIDENCFVITGGAIKFTANMEPPHLQQELTKLEKCRSFLQENDVFDADSFYELMNEEHDE